MELAQQIQQCIDRKTKPLGALGQLEELAARICMLQKRIDPNLCKPTMLVFAADHGLADEGVSAYPKDVTAQMVLNFVNGGAAINVFCRQNGIDISIIDAGVDYDFPEDLPMIARKVGRGTANMLEQPAITSQQRQTCRAHAEQLVSEQAEQGCNVLGFGEMGIGNTSAAALIMHYLTRTPIEHCIGRGTGLNDQALSAKLAILRNVIEARGPLETPEAVLQAVGGFEIAMICYGMMHAAERNMLVMVDGFIATAAALLAIRLAPSSRAAMIFCHRSDEAGHARLLDYLEAKPLLSLGMRLGEGTGCALAYPLLQAAVNFINEMASFESAGVSEKQR